MGVLKIMVAFALIMMSDKVGAQTRTLGDMHVFERFAPRQEQLQDCLHYASVRYRTAFTDKEFFVSASRSPRWDVDRPTDELVFLRLYREMFYLVAALTVQRLGIKEIDYAEYTLEIQETWVMNVAFIPFWLDGVFEQAGGSQSLFSRFFRAGLSYEQTNTRCMDLAEDTLGLRRMTQDAKNAFRQMMLRQYEDARQKALEAYIKGGDYAFSPY